MIKNIIFDFGGVLLDWNPRYFYREHFSSEEEMEYFLAEICNDEWNAQQDNGRTFSEAVKELQQKFPDYSKDIGLYDEKWDVMLKTDLPETVEILKALKSEYEIYGLTNWSAEKITIAYARYPFFELFDGIVVSGEEKLIKPDPQIYKVLLERYKLIPSESVFIDDNPANIDAAQKLGIHGILFKSSDQLKEELKKIL